MPHWQECDPNGIRQSADKTRVLRAKVNYIKLKRTGNSFCEWSMDTRIDSKEQSLVAWNSTFSEDIGIIV